MTGDPESGTGKRIAISRFYTPRFFVSHHGGGSRYHAVLRRVRDGTVLESNQRPSWRCHD